MKDGDIIVSGFDSRNESASLAVDFALAKHLDRSGSTCDAYECVVQRRRVFVKRLKAEYRDNPLYRAAFDKEYDLGVSLSHPSLPRYFGFGGDYIIMDFIEGDTLSDLIKRDNTRLKNRKFVRRLLLELVDVVDYLHRRNIVHCDIKADNVIISPYEDRPATLIDLDKAYTSWLDSTHGNTQKYGCDDCADGAIDFRGLGKIASQLRQNKVARLCEKDDVSAESIKRSLAPGNTSKLVLLLASSLVIGIPLSLWYLNSSRSSSEIPEVEPHMIAISVPDSTTVRSMKADNTPVDIPQAPPSITIPVPDMKIEAELQKPNPDDITRVTDEAVLKYYGPLYAELDYLIDLVNDSTSTGEQLDEAVHSYVEKQMKAQGDIISTVCNHFYWYEDTWYINGILCSSDEWCRFMRKDSEMSNLYFYDKRRTGKKTMP